MVLLCLVCLCFLVLVGYFFAGDGFFLGLGFFRVFCMCVFLFIWSFFVCFICMFFLKESLFTLSHL